MVVEYFLLEKRILFYSCIFSDISHSNVNMQVVCSGGMFPHSRDKDGKLIFIIKVRLNVKGIVKPEDIHRALGDHYLNC